MNSGTQNRVLQLVVFVVGLATLGAEIAAARLLAPWFGASTIVWANTIAIVLVSLSIGYAIGGRYADRNPTLSGLLKLALVAGILIAAVPYIAAPFLKGSSKAFAELSIGIFLGSLVSVGFLVAIPLLMLGMISPYAVKLAVDDLEHTGRTAGRLSAFATVGSLFGTFSASLLLIPFVGTRRSFLIYALLLILVGIFGLKRRYLGAIPVLGVIVLIALPTSVTKPGAEGAEVIWERETEYQYARVLQQGDTRTLELNEGQAIHSIHTPGRYLNGGYWDHMALMPLAAQETKKVAVLGSAGGTMPRTLTHYFDDVEIDSVEIDGEITEMGNELFDARSDQITAHAADARPWLQASNESYDAILVDAYRQPYIPFYLTTKEFFSEVLEHLRPGGIIAVNVGHPAGSDSLEKVLSATLRSVFGDQAVYRDVVSDTTSILVASTGPLPADQLDSVDHPDAEVTNLTSLIAAQLEPALSGGTVYTDDKAPVEWLIDASFAEVAGIS